MSSKSGNSDRWSLGKMYEITLNNPKPGASLFGFLRGGKQIRRFNNKEQLERYKGELWLNGLSDVTIKELDDE